MLLPKVENFSKSLFEFIEKIKNMERAIRVFDETICIKASKTQLLELSMELKMKFIQFENWHKMQVEMEVFKNDY